MKALKKLLKGRKKEPVNVETPIIEPNQETPMEVPQPEAQPKPTTEKGYVIEYTHDEIVQRIQDLQANENVQLFLKAQDGQEKVKEMEQLLALLPKK